MATPKAYVVNARVGFRSDPKTGTAGNFEGVEARRVKIQFRQIRNAFEDAISIVGTRQKAA